MKDSTSRLKAKSYQRKTNPFRNRPNALPVPKPYRSEFQIHSKLRLKKEIPAKGTFQISIAKSSLNSHGQDFSKFPGFIEKSCSCASQSKIQRIQINFLRSVLLTQFLAQNRRVVPREIQLFVRRETRKRPKRLRAIFFFEQKKVVISTFNQSHEIDCLTHETLPFK